MAEGKSIHILDTMIGQAQSYIAAEPDQVDRVEMARVLQALQRLRAKDAGE